MLHHLRFPTWALRREVSRELIVPLCRVHHREVHGCGDEASGTKTGVDAISAAAQRLWAQTMCPPPRPQPPVRRRSRGMCILHG